MGLVARLGGGDDRGVGDEGEVDPGKGDQVSFELIQVNVKSSVVWQNIYFLQLQKFKLFTLQIGERQSRRKRPEIIVNRLNLQR